MKGINLQLYNRVYYTLVPELPDLEKTPDGFSLYLKDLFELMCMPGVYERKHDIEIQIIDLIKNSVFWPSIINLKP